MAEPTVLDVLNELLAAEQRSLPVRMFESTVFVSPLSVEQCADVERMARISREHDAWLSELILELGGALGPRIGDVTSADLHFQELHHVVPRLVHAQETLIDLYVAAAQRVAGEPKARELLERIIARHRQALDVLRPASSEAGAPTL